MPRRYTRAVKGNAVAVASITSTKAASEQLGIPRKTIAYWLDDPEFAALRHRTRDLVAEEFWSAIQIGVKEVANGLRDPDTAMRDKAIALGILYDKHALLTGGATGRTESRDLSDLPDSAYIDAIREARRLTSGTPPDEPVPVEAASE